MTLGDIWAKLTHHHRAQSPRDPGFRRHDEKGSRRTGQSLIKGHWIVIGSAGLVAIALPIQLLGSEPEQPGLPPIAPPTQVEAGDSQSLTYALTAPPFTEGRVPLPEPAEGGTEQESAAPAAPPPILVGLVVSNRGRAVALAKGANGETLTLARGATIDGWTLIGITREQATFERDGARHVAALDFANRPASSAPNPSPAPVSSPPSVPAASQALPMPAPAPPRPASRNPS